MEVVRAPDQLGARAARCRRNLLEQPPPHGTVCEPDFGPFDPRPEETAAEESLAEALAPAAAP